MSKRYDIDRIFRLFLFVLVTTGLIWLLRYTADVVVPLLGAVLLAYLLDPVVHRVQRWIPNRVAAVSATLLVGCLVVLGAGALVAPAVAAEFRAAGELFSEFANEESPLRQRLQARLPDDWLPTIYAWLNSDALQEFFTQHRGFSDLLITGLKKTLPGLWGLVEGTFAVLGVVLQIVLVVVYLIFVLVDFGSLRASWKDYLPSAYRQTIADFLQEFDRQLSTYFRGQFVVASIMAVLFALGFWIVGLKLGIVLGLMVGAMNMVPYLQIVGFLPALVLAGLTAVEHDAAFWSYALPVLLVFAVVQVLQDALITPKVMGKVTGLPPVLILFSAFFWGKLLGFLGVLLAIPLTCMGLATYRQWLRNNEAT